MRPSGDASDIFYGSGADDTLLERRASNRVSLRLAEVYADAARDLPVRSLASPPATINRRWQAKSATIPVTEDRDNFILRRSSSSPRAGLDIIIRRRRKEFLGRGHATDSTSGWTGRRRSGDRSAAQSSTNLAAAGDVRNARVHRSTRVVRALALAIEEREES